MWTLYCSALLFALPEDAPPATIARAIPVKSGLQAGEKLTCLHGRFVAGPIALHSGCLLHSEAWPNGPRVVVYTRTARGEFLPLLKALNDLLPRWGEGDTMVVIGWGLVREEELKALAKAVSLKAPLALAGQDGLDRHRLNPEAAVTIVLSRGTKVDANFAFRSVDLDDTTMAEVLRQVRDTLRDRTLVFAKDDAGRLPKGWTAAKTGSGAGSVWKVVADETAPTKKGHVLAQTAAGPGPLFNLCVADDTNFKDVEVSVAFKAVKGKIDQGGGIVWRYQDADNYYIARFNPLEDNYRVYKVVGGKRIQLATKENLTAKAGEWHTLSIKMVGDQIECFLDGKKHLEAKDDAIAKAGKVGLWTKADAQTWFDDLKITEK